MCPRKRLKKILYLLLANSALFEVRINRIETIFPRCQQLVLTHLYISHGYENTWFKSDLPSYSLQLPQGLCCWSCLPSKGQG